MFAKQLKNLTFAIATALLSLSLNAALVPVFAQSNQDEMQPKNSNYQVGKVVGQSGDILAVKLEDGSVFNGVLSNSVLYRRTSVTGADVLVSREDGMYKIISFAHPQWIGVFR